MLFDQWVILEKMETGNSLLKFILLTNRALFL